jgi:hypothetical protein
MLGFFFLSSFGVDDIVFFCSRERKQRRKVNWLETVTTFSCSLQICVFSRANRLRIEIGIMFLLAFWSQNAVPICRGELFFCDWRWMETMCLREKNKRVFPYVSPTSHHMHEWVWEFNVCWEERVTYQDQRDTKDQESPALPRMVGIEWKTCPDCVIPTSWWSLEPWMEQKLSFRDNNYEDMWREGEGFFMLNILFVVNVCIVIHLLTVTINN